MMQLKQHIAVYGPPGVGKSTLISYAKNHVESAIDLEDVGATYEDRLRYLQTADLQKLTLFGAADLKPEDFPAGTKFVLLLPEKDVLRRRVELRGETCEHKWIGHAVKVHGEHNAMAENGVFDFILREDISPDAEFERIIEHFQC